MNPNVLLYSSRHVLQLNLLIISKIVFYKEFVEKYEVNHLLNIPEV